MPVVEGGKGMIRAKLRRQEMARSWGWLKPGKVGKWEEKRLEKQDRKR